MGQSLTFTGTQSSPGPQAVTITVTRATDSTLLVEAHTNTIAGDACVLGLGGTFNVQVRLKPMPVSKTDFIVMQTTKASVGEGLDTNGDGIPDAPSAPGFIKVRKGATNFADTPLSTIGISATFSPGDTAHGCSGGSPADVTYTVPVGTGSGQYRQLTFLGTQPFGNDFLPPSNITVNFCPSDDQRCADQDD